MSKKPLSETYLRGTYQIRRDAHPDLIRLHEDRERNPEKYDNLSFNEIIIQALYMWLGLFQPKPDPWQEILDGQRRILQELKTAEKQVVIKKKPQNPNDKDDVIVGI